MIKLKNLWKVALSTVAMASMLVACDTSSTEEEVTPGTYTAGTGVYQFNAPKSTIGATYNNWGGFGILLAKEDQIAKLDSNGWYHPQGVGTFAVPTAQLTCGGNLKFAKYATAKGNAEVTSSGKVLNSVWATLTENEFTIHVDMSKILLDDTAVEVKVFGDGNEFMGDDWLKSGRNLDLTGYKPYIIALVEAKGDVIVDNKTYAKEAGKCQWGDGLSFWEMTTSTAKKPTSFGKFLDEADVSAIDKTTTSQAGAEILFPGANVAVSGETVNEKGLHVTFKDGVGTAEFTIGENPEFADWKQGGDFFTAYFQFWAGDDKELAAVNKQYYVADKAVTTLGKAVKLTDDGKNGGDLIVTDLNAAGTYVVTIDALAGIPTITVTKK